MYTSIIQETDQIINLNVVVSKTIITQETELLSNMMNISSTKLLVLYQRLREWNKAISRDICKHRKVITYTIRTMKRCTKVVEDLW